MVQERNRKENNKEVSEFTKWRFIRHTAPASFIQASQETILTSVGKGLALPTVRLLLFKPPAITVGYYQNVEEEVNLEEAKRHGLDIMRRCTGGGAIIQSEDAPGWDIYVPETLRNLPVKIEDSFAFLSKPIVDFFRTMGVDAKFRPKNDVEVGGRKISGISQVRESGCILQTGSFLFDFDIPLMLKVLKLPIEKLSDKTVKSFEERITTVKRETGYKPSVEEVEEKFKRAVERAFCTELENGALNKFEEFDLEERLKKYRSRKWIHSLRSCRGHVLTYVTKTPGGLIRVHAKVSENVVESVLITGDFYIYPQRAIYDLEAYLKWTRVDEIFIKVKEFFEQNKAVVLRLTPDDMAEILSKAVKC